MSSPTGADWTDSFATRNAGCINSAVCVSGHENTLHVHTIEARKRCAAVHVSAAVHHSFALVGRSRVPPSALVCRCSFHLFSSQPRVSLPRRMSVHGLQAQTGRTVSFHVKISASAGTRPHCTSAQSKNTDGVLPSKLALLDGTLLIITGCSITSTCSVEQF